MTKKSRIDVCSTSVVPLGFEVDPTLHAGAPLAAAHVPESSARR